VLRAPQCRAKHAQSHAGPKRGAGPQAEWIRPTRGVPSGYAGVPMASGTPLRCTVCDSGRWHLLLDSEAVSAQIAARERYFRQRIRSDAINPKDVFDYVHRDPTEILICETCGSLQRADLTVDDLRTRYEEDSYDATTLALLYSIYLEGFTARASRYKPLLPQGARVLELGSHVGGFLAVAKDWGWDPIGIDVGRDVAKYANERGHTTLADLSEALTLGPFDGIFVWNCFEQLPDPAGTLRELSTILRSGGHLLIRTPNAVFLTLVTSMLELHRETAYADLADDTTFAALAVNGLTGCPFARVFTPPAVEQLAIRAGFAIDRGFDSELMSIASQYYASPKELTREHSIHSTISRLARRMRFGTPGTSFGPWIELLFRANGPHESVRSAHKADKEMNTP
jgi:SAM-dependent methyltransferase